MKHTTASTLLLVQILLWLFNGSPVSGQSVGSNCVNNEFETSLLMSYDSTVPGEELSQADIDDITNGFMITYNQIQAAICDDNTKLIDDVNGTLVVPARRLDNHDVDVVDNLIHDEQAHNDHHRQLPSTGYILAISMALRGRSRQTSGQVTLFNNDAPRQRRLGEVAALKSQRDNVDLFLAKYAHWLAKQQKTGKLGNGKALGVTPKILTQYFES
jgi:hypothetical protein